MRQIHVESDSSNHARKFSFYTPKEGYVAFDKGIGYTTDTGRTFTMKKITMSNVNYNFNEVNLTLGFSAAGVQAFDKNNILVYGDFSFEPTILSSSDGGETFTVVYWEPLDPSIFYGITNIVFPRKDNIGYAVCPNHVLKTTDRGLTWSIILLAGNDYYSDVQVAADSNFVVATGRSKTVFGIKNQGASFVNLQPPSTIGFKLNSAYFLSPTTGWVSMTDGDAGLIYKTTDGGDHWTLLNDKTVTPFAFGKMKFFDENTGYALPINYQNRIFKTRNGGVTWEQLPRDNSYGYLGWTHNDLYFYSEKQFWAGGGHGFIELTNNGGGIPLPRAYFKIDTTGLNATGKVQLKNYSQTDYSYKWFLNDTLISTAYELSYNHYLYSNWDSIKLVVSKNGYTDSLVLLQYFNAPTAPPVLTIKDFNPKKGFPEAEITITGTYLSSVTNVYFGNMPAASFKIISDTVIKAMIFPPGDEGNIKLVSPGATVQMPGFTYESRLKITSISPTSGTIGTEVTISGEKFNPVADQNIVFFGGVRAQVVSATANKIVVKAPPGASYERITVETNGLMAQSSYPFLITFDGVRGIDSLTFQDKFDITYQSTFAFQIADIDGDGKPDIISSDSHGDRLVIQRNTSTNDQISFDNKIFLPVSQFNGEEVVNIADFNGDGKLDILTNDTRSQAMLSFFINQSTPGNISFVRKNLWVKSYYAQPHLLSLAVADVNNDGRPDIVGQQSAQMAFLKNISTRDSLAFEWVGPLLQVPDTGGSNIADIDGDGKIDLITNYYDEGRGFMAVYRNISVNDSIMFGPVLKLPVLSYRSGFALADINQDGKLDIVANSPSPDQTGIVISVFKNISTKGTIAFEASTDFNLPATDYSHLAINDIDGDGKTDIVLAHVNPDKPFVSILKNTSAVNTISFDPKVEIWKKPFAWNYYPIVLNDMNLDGKPDIIATNMTPGPNPPHLLSILKNSAGYITIPGCEGESTNVTAKQSGTRYQWQQNSGEGFFDMQDNISFTGTTTDTLRILNVRVSWNKNIYRCIVDGQSGEEYMLHAEDKKTPAVSLAITDSALCAGKTTTLKAIATNGGSSPVFEWTLNGEKISADSSIFTSTTLKNNDKVAVLLRSNAACLSAPTASSDVVTLHINTPSEAPSIKISADTNSICFATEKRISSEVINGGDEPVLQWYVNGVPSGVTNQGFVSYSFHNNDSVQAMLISSAACLLHDSAYSNVIAVKVDTLVTPAVTINATSANVCAGENVTFTAQPASEGTNPHYSWLVNGLNAGTNSNIFNTTTLPKDATVYVVLLSDAKCVTWNTAQSNEISVNVTFPKIPAISIATPPSVICKGQEISLIAQPVDADALVSYQWHVNGQNTGSNANTFVSKSFSNGDTVSVSMNVLASGCRLKDTIVVSNNITLNVKDSGRNTITIDGNINLTQGITTTTIRSYITGPGILAYQWQDSTNNHNWLDIGGQTKSSITYKPFKTGDKLRCILVNSSACSISSSISNTLQFIVTEIDTSAHRVKLYPNPVTSTFTIGDLKPSDEWVALEILSESGVKLLGADLTGKASIKVPVANLPRGTYIARLIRSNQKSITVRFIKI